MVISPYSDYFTLTFEPRKPIKSTKHRMLT